MNPYRLSTFRKCCATALAFSLALQPIVGSAVTITNSNLSELPLQGISRVKPNIMLTIDDSGSMDFDFLPDYIAWAGTGISHCRDGVAQCGDGQVPGFPSSSLFMTFIPNGLVFTQYDPPVRSSAYNRQYYDATANYDVGRTSDGVSLAYESANPGTATSVYVNGFAGYPAGNTGGTIDLTTRYPDTAWCNALAGSPASASDLATAFGDGSRCRLNGRPYSAAADPVSNLWTTPAISAGYNYPNALNVSNGAGTACASVNEYCVFNKPNLVLGNPYYYTISKVQYCSNKDAAGFGTPPCQDRYDQSGTTPFIYARYGTNSAKSFDPQAFTRVDIKASGFLVNGVASSNPSGRSYADEMANFAKWYTFYRSRILSMKTATGIAFTALTDENARVGLHTLRLGTAGGTTYTPNGNNNNNPFLNVLPFNATNKSAWYTALYGLKMGFGTPLPDAVWRIGELFAGNIGGSGLPGATDPLDPVTGMCQPNYHLLSTDGYWNFGLANQVGDNDQTVPTLPGAVPGFTAGSSFPRPQYEGPQATSNTLADLAMYYWIRDLRPGLPDKVNDTIAPWQHVSFYGLSIGAQGSVPYPTGIDAITAGTRNWPLTKSGSPAQFIANAGPDAIDDLWHAAVNSGGKFFNAGNPQELAASIVSALSDFTGQAGTGTAVGIAGAQFSATKTFGYRTSYETGWWGDIKKYALDPNTGALPLNSAGNPANPPLWSAATSTDAQFAGDGWNLNRRIVTINDASNTVVPFRTSSLSPSQQTSLNVGWQLVTPMPTADAVLNYLRGDKSNEGVSATNFRVRTHLLGDIVYSGAVPVGAPGQPYDDTGNPGYSAFVAAQKTRTPMVYVGANDGMLHAFNDSTTADAGTEVWAYVPKALFSNGDPNDSTHTASPEFQLGSRAWNLLPTFKHKFYVNATPRVWDIDFANTNTSTPPLSGNDWHTILIGGLGAGARAVYALDVTQPPAPTDTEGQIASSGRVLWEFTDPNLGYVYDPPTLVKTKRFGWVALVPSGYNNPGGKGILYVLNPTDGRILKQISTRVGSDANPSGLSTIRAFAPSRRDPYVLQAYGGDLLGNVWRFDLSDPDESKWKAELVARLTDASGQEQPITTGVRIEIDQNNNIDRYLFVGTGKLLGQDDIAANTVGNTLYVIRDGTRTAPEPAPSTPYSRADLNTVTATSITGFSGVATGRGWYQDGVDKSEKIGTDVFADVQTVVFAFSKPSTDPCAGILQSTLYARDFLTGNSVLQSEGGTIVSGIDIGQGIAGVALIQGQGGSTSSSGSSGDVRVQVTTMKGQVFSFGVKLPPSATLKHRVSWRLLNRE